ncbi:helix-turn-helix transcriptional regulator [Pandoraea sp. SD6-2]|uniref:helix-turn-helix domain-containing protein n=1 Tax=Pandoraea sp. SD6-2 TaxID=1286093 RepID=UPI0003311AB6|nr:helix-turn-helix transcriptional regulator [Pandoraea sp. SD6-2]EON15340.1 hypothetical protein C266_02606 [Pandoraea sp. SD6-2]
MKTTVDYLDAVKARLDLPSDYAAAKALGVTRAAVSRHRNGLSVFDEATAVRVAEILGIEPIEVISACKAEGSTDAHMREVWHGVWEKISKGFRTLVLPANARGALFSAA